MRRPPATLKRLLSAGVRLSKSDFCITSGLVAYSLAETVADAAGVAGVLGVVAVEVARWITGEGLAVAVGAGRAGDGFAVAA